MSELTVNPVSVTDFAYEMYTCPVSVNELSCELSTQPVIAIDSNIELTTWEMALNLSDFVPAAIPFQSMCLFRNCPLV